MRIVKETINLECKLTDKEKLEYSKQISEAITRRAGIEDTLKAIQSQKKAEIAEHEEKINRLASYINSGFEYRMIECKIEYDFKAKERRWIRGDNKEIAKTDIIPEKDLQEEFKLKNPKKGTDKKSAEKKNADELFKDNKDPAKEGKNEKKDAPKPEAEKKKAPAKKKKAPVNKTAESVEPSHTMSGKHEQTTNA